MSEIENNGIGLIQIKAPELNQSEYAKNLSETFYNIDKNFAILANYDFIKGESGNSINIKEVLFYDENRDLTEYGKMLISYFETKYPDTYNKKITLQDDTVLGLFDNFTPEKAGKLYLMVEVHDNTAEEYTPFSSLYYVFLDGRFSNDKMGAINPKQYDGLEDLSCILVYDKDVDGFKSLDNAFPTIYYDSKIEGFCWKVNGNNTGISVQGIPGKPGKDGKDARLQLVECKTQTDSDDNVFDKKARVTKIYQYPSSISIENVEDINEYDNCSSMILTNDSNKSYLYLGILKVDNGVLYAYYSTGTEMTNSLDIVNFINILKSININSTAEIPLRGLFIPMENEKNSSAESRQAVHLIAATNIIKNNVNDSKAVKNTDVILAGIDDINEFDPTLNSKSFLAEKYLYLKVDQSHEMFNVDSNSFSNNIINNIKIELANNNEGCSILKYKLSHIYYDHSNIPGDSMQFGSDNSGSSNLTFNYYVNSGSNANTSEHHYDSFPEEFTKRFNNAGIYCWELCTNKHDFDNELYRSGKTITYGNTTKEYLKYVFTTTVNPNISTDFVWFNGLQSCNEYIENFENFTPNTYTIYGWGIMSDHPLFKLVKFVPLINNDFKAKNDTLLNLSYDVNITGDNDDIERNMTVSGAINCKDLKASNIISAKEIESIYTKNEIIGDDGLKIGKHGKSSEYNLEVQSNGDTTLNGELTVNDITCENNINSKSINVTNVASFKDADINVYSGKETLLSIKPYFSRRSNVSAQADPTININTAVSEDDMSEEDKGSTPETPDAQEQPVHELNIDANSIKSININRSSNFSIITTGVTSVNTNNAGVIVSNVEASSGLLPYYGTPGFISNKTNAVLDSLKEKLGENLDLTAEIPLTYIYNNDIENVSSLLKEENLLINENYKTLQSDITASNYSTLEKDESIIYDVTLSKKNSGNYYSYDFDEEHGIELKFGYYMFLANLQSKRSYLSWPKLSELSLILHAYYTIKNEEIKINSTKEIKFETLPDDPKDQSSNTNIWYGVDLNGNILKDNINLIDRYQGFIFKPNDWKILVNGESELNTIRAAYDKEYDINIKVKAELKFKFIIERHPSFNMNIPPIAIKGFKVTRLVPINLIDNNKMYKYIKIDNGYAYAEITDKSYDIVHSVYSFLYADKDDNAILRLKWGETENDNNHPLTWNIASNAPIATSYLTYGVKKTISSEEINSTNICEDGIVIRAADRLFGIGYIKTDKSESSPCIFYYDKDEKDVKYRYKKLYNLCDTAYNG